MTEGATTNVLGSDHEAPQHKQLAAAHVIPQEGQRPERPEALAGLKAEGVRVVMLTGDNWTTARAVAKHLGIDEVEAEVLPDQKSAVVDKFKRAGRMSPWKARA